jgi:hypothetical protein
MFEETDFLIELEIILHEKEDFELLDYMNENLENIIIKMNKVKSYVTETKFQDEYLQSDFARMNYLYFTLIDLWVRRN